MRSRVLVAGILAAAVFVLGAVRAAEDDDYGVAPRASLRRGDYAAPTPRAIPGAKTIATAELRARLNGPTPERPLLFDVLGGAPHASLPGAIWLPGAGRGESFSDAVQERLALVLQAATRGDLARPVAFFCRGSTCWLSYNAALRAAALGYREVYWYRGGIEAWAAAGAPLVPLHLRWREPVR
jgi:PQQ-dependent catabolism-associated CXXCW motif protein